MIVGDNSSRDSSTIETIEGTLTDSGAANPHISPKGPEKAALSGIKRLSRTFHKPNKGGPYDDRV